MKHYNLFNIPPIFPAVYDETLSYYESICRIAKRVDLLMKDINENFDERAAKFIDKYVNNYVAGNFTYTEEDKGLHLDMHGAIISGDHKYDSKAKTMEILRWDDDDEEE